MPGRVNIGMVAAEAGVGVGTVSRVLNGSPRVREETRRRVLAVMDAMNYHPSRVATSLSRGTTMTISVLVTFLTRPSVVQRLAGVIAVLDARGYDTVVFNIETAEQRDRHLTTLTREAHADGAIVVSLPLRRCHVEAIKARELPVVILDAETTGPPRFVIDNVHGGRMATEHLLDLGHKRIAFIGDRSNGDLSFTSTEHRFEGYRNALHDADIVVDSALVRRDEQSGPVAAPLSLEMAESLLDQRDPPTAFFAASDVQAIALMHAIDDRGLRVPEDVSVMGFDDIDAAGLVRLSTVRQPLEESGAIAARRLCDLLDGRNGGRRRTVLPLELVPRGTTAAPARSTQPPKRQNQRRHHENQLSLSGTGTADSADTNRTPRTHGRSAAPTY